MKFEITKYQHIKIEDWLNTIVYPEVIQHQKEYLAPSEFVNHCWDNNIPYEGAIGGGLTYSFSPTSIGIVCKVCYQDYELDITDYDQW